ncbi:hypothetical protein VTP01DRAFT_3640 [Rhizomucor pusillus]|uniref:uncharacterized protein n=1 Tax=Rhizomucor pusillus TaxID=4840 RepID=UPI0037448FEC
MSHIQEALSHKAWHLEKYIKYARTMDYLVDEETYALETVSSHTQCLCNMPRVSDREPAAMRTDEPKDADAHMREATVKREYALYADQDKVWFFELMFEKNLSASAAAHQLGIHVRTAQRWVTQHEKDPDSISKKRRKKGRPRILTAEHQKVILDSLRDLRSRRALYEFVRTQCNLTLKKAWFQSVDRNSEAKIQERLDWVRKWETTHGLWEKLCASAMVTAPKTRVKTTTILGAISALGLIKCSPRLPQPPAKKRNEEATMDEMDKYPHMKGHYLVLDNGPIHKSEDIQKYIKSRKYRYAYLPSYSPELNPIEQFWSVVKSKVKRNRLLEKRDTDDQNY